MILSHLLKIFLFLLPWQTMWIYREPFLNGGKWEYGALGYYATEVLLWVCIGLFMFQYFKKIQDTIRQLADKIQFQFSKDRIFLLASLLFIIYLLFSSVRSLDPSLAMQQTIRIIEAIFLFLMLFSGVLSFRESALWFTTGAIMPSILGIWQFLSQSTVASTLFGLSEHMVSLGGTSVIAGEEIGRVLRAYGSFSHPNVFGGYLAIVLAIIFLQNLHASRILGIKTRHPEEPHKATKDLTKSRFFDLPRPNEIQTTMASSDPSLRFAEFTLSETNVFRMTLGTIIQSKIIRYICIGIVSAALFFSFSRSAWIAFGIVITACLFSNVRRKKYSIFHIQYSIFSLIIFLTLSAIYFPLVQTRFAAESPHELRSTTERVSGYAEAIGLFKEHPWLGVGPGNYTRASIEKDPARPGWEYQPAHNAGLLALAEFGLVGVLLIVGIAVSFIVYYASCVSKHVFHLIVMMGVFFPLFLFDHYLLSSYIGLMIFGAFSGMIFSLQNEERA